MDLDERGLVEDHTVGLAEGGLEERALDGLVADGLVELVGDDRYGLPSRA